MVKCARSRRRFRNPVFKRFQALALAFALVLSGLGTLKLTGVLAADEESGAITVRKVDEDGRSLPGARLQLLNSQDQVVDEWVSDGTAHVVENLPFGNYVLHEKKAPVGYEQAADMLVILTPSLENVLGPGVPVQIGSTLTGYSHGISMNGTAAYCLDRTTLFNGQSAASSQSLSQIDASGVPSDLSNGENIVARKDNIIKALIAGYPNDALGIGKKYDLSAKDFNRVTQDVIWKLVNNEEPGSNDSSWEDYNAHRDPRYKLYYEELMAAALDKDNQLDISGYEATIYWTRNSQPIVGALYNKSAEAKVTMVNKKAAAVSVSISKSWQGEISKDEELWATFQLYQNGTAYGDPVTLNEETGWTYKFKGLPAGYTYEVKEVAASCNQLDTNPTVGHEVVTLPGTTGMVTKKGLKEVEPQLGGTYVIHVESWNAQDGQHNVRVLRDPLSVNSNNLPTNLENIPAGSLWTLVSAENGGYYLRSGNNNTVTLTGAGDSLDAILTNQNRGARFTHSRNTDRSYSLKAKWGVPERDYFFTITKENKIQFVRDNVSGAGNKVRFYQVVEETFEVTTPGTTVTTGWTYGFTNIVEKPTEPVTEPTEPVTEPTEPVTEPTEPVTEPTEPVTEPTEPVTEPTEPVTEPTEPVTEPTEPVTEPTEPVTEPTEPVTEPTEPVTEPTEPVTEPTEPVTEPTEPVTEPTEPVTEPTEPVTEPTEPVTEPTEPVTEPTEPVTEPTEPVTEPTEAVTEPTEPVHVSVEIKINKTDMDGFEVEGAQITVRDIEGNVVDSWLSKEGETKDIILEPGEYILVEEAGPEGYIRVETEIHFTVDEKGQVTVLTTRVEPAGACEVDENGVLILKNEMDTVPVEEESEESFTPESPTEDEPVNPETDVPVTVPAEEETEPTAVENEAEVPTEPSQTTPGTTNPALPDTGDNSHMGLYMGLCVAAAVGVFLTLGIRRKRSEEE